MKVAHILLSFAFFVLLAPVASAQITGGTSFDRSTVVIDPLFPEPGETVVANLELYGSDVFNTDIVWTVNGEVIGDANNRRSVEYSAGALGTTDVVTATLVRPDRSNRRFSISYQPAYLDFVVEAQTRVPDFYEGRAVPSVGSEVNVTALLNTGNIVDDRTHTYTWRLSGQVLDGGPISGSNQVSFSMPRGTRSFLSVDIVNDEGFPVGSRAFGLESVYPDMVFYEQNTLYGQSEIAVDDQIVLIGQAATVVAEPYNMDILAYNDPDIRDWEIDGTQTTTNTANPYRITIQRTGESGQSDVSFHVRSTSELLQGVKDDFVVQY